MKRAVFFGFFISAIWSSAYAEAPFDQKKVNWMMQEEVKLDTIVGFAESCGLRTHEWASREVGASIFAEKDFLYILYPNSDQGNKQVIKSRLTLLINDIERAYAEGRFANDPPCQSLKRNTGLMDMIDRHLTTDTPP